MLLRLGCARCLVQSGAQKEREEASPPRTAPSQTAEGRRMSGYSYLLNGLLAKRLYTRFKERNASCGNSRNIGVD